MDADLQGLYDDDQGGDFYDTPKVSYYLHLILFLNFTLALFSELLADTTGQCSQ